MPKLTLPFALTLAILAGCRSAARNDPAASRPAAQPRIVQPFPGVTVHLLPPDRSHVEIQALACLDAGWLEQVLCSPQTREHESLMVTTVKPSHIHAALLMAAFNPGSPGKWVYENDTLQTIDPTGEKLDIFVRYRDPSGKVVEHPVRTWIRDGAAYGEHPESRAETAGQIAQQPAATAPAREFPDLPWVFAGSIIAPNPPDWAPGEHYVADMTGSIIGLVTFGDEVIGFSKVLADQADVQDPEWEVNTAAVPPPGTEVTVIVRKHQTDQ